MIPPRLLIATFLSWLLMAQVCEASSNGGKSSIYPISNLESSLAASASQASLVAIRGDDCVVIVSMSPRQKSNKAVIAERRTNGDHGDDDDDNETQYLEENFLTPVLSHGAIQTNMSTSNQVITSRIMHVLQKSSGLCLFMTGFSADTQYLVRYAASHVSEHEHLNGGTPFHAQSLVRDALAPRLRDATMASGTRPFGIQAMAVSCHPQAGSPMQVITTDPSGNYRYWHGVGTGIGKDSQLIKKHLHEIINDEYTGKIPNDWSEALDACIMTLLETVEESQNMKETPTEEILEELDGLVIFDAHKNRQGQSSPCAVISRSSLRNSFHKCLSSKKRSQSE
jgi:20S proteasome alpha/beta subunit